MELEESTTRLTFLHKPHSTSLQPPIAPLHHCIYIPEHRWFELFFVAFGININIINIIRTILVRLPNTTVANEHVSVRYH